MDLREALLAEHSRRQSDLICDYIGQDLPRFKALFQLSADSDETVARRAAWSIGHLADAQPDLVDSMIDQILKRLLQEPDLHQAIKRNFLRILQGAIVPTDQLGRLYELCYCIVSNPDESAAVRVYAMTILSRICETEPELAEEVIFLINDASRGASAAYHSRGRQVLKKLNKLAKKNS